MEFNLNYEKGIINEIEDICLRQLSEKIFKPVTDLNVEFYHSKEPLKFEEIKQQELKKITTGESWGKLFDCGWFKLTGVISPNALKEDLYLHLDLSGEALLYDKKMIPLKGFTNGSSVFDRAHGEPGKEFYKINELIDNGKLLLWVEAGCNDLFGNLQNNGVLHFARIVTKNNDLEKLFFDLEALISLLKCLDRKDSLYQVLFQGLNTIKNYLLYQTQDHIQNSLSISKKLLRITTNNHLAITAVAHAHLDLAWLWPIRETKRKAIRTITNVLFLLKQNPEMVFVISQPQQLIWIKEQSHEVFEEIKKFVEKGQIELVGGMFVEADTNVTGEESLCRQMLYGVKYYQEEFGVRVKNLWLPDAFGYSGAIPQIMKKSGLDHFMTIKISWNLVNKFPYHTMLWKGIDDTQVLAHMPPEGTYNSSALPRSVKESEHNYHQSNQANDILMVYGIGDGGGGPGIEHLERIKREENWANLPKVKMGRVDDFFNRLEKYEDKLPTWKGELYLENHQGTYTSQSNIKRYNRLLENKLKAVETYLVHKNSYRKFQKQLDIIWKEVLLYQFHDILPGSSIKRVYDEALTRYQVLEQELDKIMLEANESHSKDYEQGLVIYNHNLFEVKKLYELNDSYHEITIEPLSTNSKTNIYEKNDVIFNGTVETKNLIIRISKEKGYLESIYDKRIGMELLQAPSNKLRVYQDFGDAWNILDHYRSQDEVLMGLSNQTVSSYGPIVEINNSYRFNNSTVMETIIINRNDDMITFKHDVDWQDLKYMLRTSFDTIVKSDNVVCDIQFGNIERTRKEETSIEKAQFEICAQNWVNVSNDNVSISLLNNAKYGHYVKGSILDLNLLRSTNYPCTAGDIGKTSYQYALLIKEKDFPLTLVDNIAMNFSSNYLMFRKEELSQLLSIDNSNIEYSTIKGSYDGTGIVLRLYEKSGNRSKANLEFNRKVASVKEVNITEEDLSSLELQNNSIVLDFKPFEIKTLKIVF